LNDACKPVTGLAFEQGSIIITPERHEKRNRMMTSGNVVFEEYYLLSPAESNFYTKSEIPVRPVHVQQHVLFYLSGHCLGLDDVVNDGIQEDTSNTDRATNQLDGV
jgi:hypothetical protein